MIGFFSAFAEGGSVEPPSSAHGIRALERSTTAPYDASVAVSRHKGQIHKRPQIPLPENISIIHDKAALAEQLYAWAAEPALRRIIISHGDIIDDNPAQVPRDVAHTLA